MGLLPQHWLHPGMLCVAFHTYSIFLGSSLGIVPRLPCLSTTSFLDPRPLLWGKPDHELMARGIHSPVGDKSRHGWSSSPYPLLSPGGQRKPVLPMILPSRRFWSFRVSSLCLSPGTGQQCARSSGGACLETVEKIRSGQGLWRGMEFSSRAAQARSPLHTGLRTRAV